MDFFSYIFLVVGIEVALYIRRNSRACVGRHHIIFSFFSPAFDFTIFISYAASNSGHFPNSFAFIPGLTLFFRLFICISCQAVGDGVSDDQNSE